MGNDTDNKATQAASPKGASTAVSADTQALVRAIDTFAANRENILLAQLVVLLRDAKSQAGEIASGSPNPSPGSDADNNTQTNFASTFRNSLFQLNYQNEGEFKNYLFKLFNGKGVQPTLKTRLGRERKYYMYVPWGGYALEGSQTEVLYFDYKPNNQGNVTVDIYFAGNKHKELYALPINETNYLKPLETKDPRKLKKKASELLLTEGQTIPSDSNTVSKRQRFKAWRQHNPMQFRRSLVLSLGLGFAMSILTGSLGIGFFDNQHLINLGEAGSLFVGLTTFVAAFSFFVYQYAYAKGISGRHYHFDPSNPESQYGSITRLRDLWVNHKARAATTGALYMVAAFVIVSVILSVAGALPENLSGFGLIPALTDISKTATFLLSLTTAFTLMFVRDAIADRSANIVRKQGLATSELDVAKEESGLELYDYTEEAKSDLGLFNDPDTTQAHIRIANEKLDELSADGKSAATEKPMITDGPFSARMGGGRLNQILDDNEALRSAKSAKNH